MPNYYNPKLKTPVATYLVWTILFLGLSVMLKRLVLPARTSLLSRSKGTSFSSPGFKVMADPSNESNLSHRNQALPSAVRLTYVTAPSSTVAESLAEKIVTSKLAACVNIIPGVTSIYEWQGKIEKDQEVSMIIKSTVGNSEELKKLITKEHPYDEPAIVSLEVDEGSSSETFMKWIKETVKGN